MGTAGWLASSYLTVQARLVNNDAKIIKKYNKIPLQNSHGTIIRVKTTLNKLKKTAIVQQVRV